MRIPYFIENSKTDLQNHHYLIKCCHKGWNPKRIASPHCLMVTTGCSDCDLTLARGLGVAWWHSSCTACTKREGFDPAQERGAKRNRKRDNWKPAVLFNLNTFMFDYLPVPVLVNRTDELQIMKDI